MTGEGGGASAPAELAGRPPRLAAHFASMGVQLDAGRLGIWLFLASEVLFFGGLLGAYAVYRANHPALFRYGRAFLDWRLGALNTAVLIGSSLSAAWSVRSAQLGRRRALVATLLVTLALAGVFMGVKGVEYGHKLHHGVGWGTAYRPSADILAALPGALRAAPPPPHVGTFFSLYFLLTGLHGIHVLVGMGLYAWLLRRTVRGDFGPGYYVPIDVVALYWHLVDIVWMFLFPLLYLT